MGKSVKFDEFYIDPTAISGILSHQVGIGANNLQAGLALASGDNFPATGAFVTLTIIYDGDRRIQFAYSLGFEGKLYLRQKLNTWSAWKQITFN